MAEPNDREVKLAHRVDHDIVLLSEDTHTLEEMGERTREMLAMRFAEYREELAAEHAASNERTTEPIPYPERIDWEERDEEELGHYFAGVPTFNHDAYEQEEIRAHEDVFEASLGSFSTTGDASGFEESKRLGEAAFRALIDLSNKLSQEAARG